MLLMMLLEEALGGTAVLFSWSQSINRKRRPPLSPKPRVHPHVNSYSPGASFLRFTTP